MNNSFLLLSVEDDFWFGVELLTHEMYISPLFIMGKDILLLFYRIPFCNLEIVRQCADLITSQTYDCEVIRQILDFLRCSFKNLLDTVCPASASQYSNMSPDKNVCFFH